MTATLLGHLARVCSQQGKHDLSAQMLERQLRMYETEEALQALLSERVTSTLELAEAYRALEREEEAEELSAKAAGMMEEVKEKIRAIEAEERRQAELAAIEDQE